MITQIIEILAKLTPGLSKEYADEAHQTINRAEQLFRFVISSGGNLTSKWLINGVYIDCSKLVLELERIANVSGSNKLSKLLNRLIVELNELWNHSVTSPLIVTVETSLPNMEQQKINLEKSNKQLEISDLSIEIIKESRKILYRLEKTQKFKN